MPIKKLQTRHWVAISLGLFSFFVLIGLFLKGELSARFNKSDTPQVVLSSGTITSGETLAHALNRHAISANTIHAIQKSLNEKLDLRSLRPGQQYTLVTSTSGAFLKLIYNTTSIHSYTVSVSSLGKYECLPQTEKTVWMEKHLSCIVKENLYKDLLTEGYDESFVAHLIADVADNIFAWRVDFFTEQRPGDRLDVLLEQEFAVGKETPLWGGRGRVLAASYEGKSTHNKKNVAIRYQAPGEDRGNFYDEKGQAVRKAFLRAPFTHSGFRISSYFNLRRFHPIRRIYRPHHGIDYAAPSGTPVAAVGHGRVVYAGWKGAYGKCIEVRHNNNYLSRYGHLSRMGVKPGQTVTQGQNIGHVGSTGLSTGPHLHFEMIVGGARQNFLRMNFPAAKSISPKNMESFKLVKQELLSRLWSGSALAQAQVEQATENN